MKLRGWKGPRDDSRGGKARKGEAGVGGLITTRTRRGAPLRMHACRVVADQETERKECVRVNIASPPLLY